MRDARGGPTGWIIAVVVGGGCVIALAVACIFLAGVYQGFTRTVDVETDEEMVRHELAIPADASLVALTADPQVSGTFGREGLRIVATFELPPAALAAYASSRRGSPGWAALPIDDAVFAMTAPPDELPRDIERGIYFCQTGTWRVGTEFDPHPCNPAPARYDQYRTAVLDEDTGRLTVVFKNYY